MKIKSVIINNVNGIKHLEIPFDPQFNIICGPNGIGKTTILESIAFRLARGENNYLKRKADSNDASISVTYVFDGKEETLKDLAIIQDDPGNKYPDGMYKHFGVFESSFVMSLKIERYFSYTTLDTIKRNEKNDNLPLVSQSLNGGIDLSSVKNWFVRQYLYEPREKSLTENQRKNLALAKRSFALLTNAVKFSHVDSHSNDIMVDTPEGVIPYEQLSSGFKSCMAIILGVIQEVERRFDKPDYAAEEIEGVILVDELDLHLHPSWQAKIIAILTTAFPNMQFISTTHSPHIIQSAQSNQVLALEYTPEGIALRSAKSLPYGYQGWTIEEILTDIMGMEDIYSSFYRDTLKSFEQSIEHEDYQKAVEAFDLLDGMLHPASYTRQILNLDLKMLKGLQVDQA